MCRGRRGVIFSLDSVVGGVGEGKGRGSGEECWGQRGENNGVTKAALFRSCGRGKTGISQG